MEIQTQIYRSSNGDCWYLMEDKASGLRSVRHQANGPSGGAITDIVLDDFLSVNGSGPEFVHLRRILAEAA